MFLIWQMQCDPQHVSPCISRHNPVPHNAGMSWVYCRACCTTSHPQALALTPWPSWKESPGTTTTQTTLPSLPHSTPQHIWQHITKEKWKIKGLIELLWIQMLCYYLSFMFLFKYSPPNYTSGVLGSLFTRTN